MMMMMLQYGRVCPQRDLRLASRGLGHQGPIKEGEKKPEPSCWVKLSSVIITQKVLGLAIVDGWAEWKMEHPRISGIGGDPYVRCTVYGLRWDGRVEASCNRIERRRDGADEPRGKRSLE